MSHWDTMGARFCGIFHTHPVNQRSLSSADRQYITEFLNINNIITEPFLFPVVIPGKEIVFFQAITLSGHVRIEEVQSIAFIE